MSSAIAGSDVAKLLHVKLDFRRARAARIMLRAVDAFDAAKPSDRSAVAERFKAEYGALIPRGLDVKSLFRKARKARLAEDEARRSGADVGLARAAAILGSQLVNRATARGLAANREFVEYWWSLVTKFNRKNAPAYNALLTVLAKGDPIPGFGTWRQIWAAENGGVPPPDWMKCPWGPITGTAPKGWSWRNVQTINPPPEVLTAVRKGTGAAYMEYMPTVHQTRAGLESCECVEFDDVWLEQKVNYAGNRHAQRVVGLVGYDVATACFFGMLFRPRTENDDGTRETIRQTYMRWEIAHLLCDVGVVAATHVDEAENGSYFDLEFPDWPQGHPWYGRPMPIQTMTPINAERTRLTAETPSRLLFGLTEGHFGTKMAWLSPHAVRVWPGVREPGQYAAPVNDYYYGAAINRQTVDQMRKDAIYRTPVGT